MGNLFKCFVVVFTVVLLSIGAHLVYSQTNKHTIDSLYGEYLKTQSDSDKVKILLQLSTSVGGCEDSAKKFGYVNEAAKISHKLKWDKGRLECYTVLGHYYSNCLKNFQKAIECHQNSAYLAQTLNDTVSEALSLEHVAKNYENLGQHDQSLGYLRKVLALNASPGINMGVLGDMGVI